MSLLSVVQTQTVVDPFSGVPLGPPKIHFELVPTDIDTSPPPDGTIEQVLFWVDGSSERARAAQMHELGREGGPRASLLSKLEKI